MEIARLEATGGDKGVIAEKRMLMERIDHGRAEPDAGPARLPPFGHRVSRFFPRCRFAPLRPRQRDPKPEIMIPLVSTVKEDKMRSVTADEIATKADFFSFGTNDLTQTTFGFSRDDVEAEFIPQYLAEKLLPYNPFATVDPGVAKLVKMGVELGHEGNPDLVCGVCGEHGGDPRLGRDLPQDWSRLRFVQPLPRAAGSPGCRSGCYRRQAVIESVDSC